MGELLNSTLSIRFSGFEMDVEALSELLECEPTQVRSRARSVMRDGKKVHREQKIWLLEYGETDGVELEEKIESLLRRLTQDLVKWHDATSTYQADMFCGLFLDDLNQGFELSPKLLKKLAGRNLKIGFDIYAPTDSWGQDETEAGSPSDE